MESCPSLDSAVARSPGMACVLYTPGASQYKISFKTYTIYIIHVCQKNVIHRHVDKKHDNQQQITIQHADDHAKITYWHTRTQIPIFCSFENISFYILEYYTQNNE